MADNSDSTNESSGDQPASVPDLLKDAFRDDGRINGRSAFGRGVRAVQDLLQADRSHGCEEIIEADVCLLAVLQRAITQWVIAHPDQFIVNGELSPLIKNDLLKIQTQKRVNMMTLIDIQRRSKGGKGTGKRSAIDDITFE